MMSQAIASQIETSTGPELAPPRVSLTSLPAEILSRITQFTDRNSFLALQRASRHLLSLDDRPLWEHLQLTISRCFGASPYICPFTPITPEEEEEAGVDGKSDYLTWLDGEEMRAATQYRLGLRDKLKHIIKLADDRAWAAVKRVTMSPQFGSLYPMLLILDYAHTGLEHLQIDAAPLLPVTSYTDAERFPSYAFNVIGGSEFPPSFPNLTYLHLTHLSSSEGLFLWKLCDLSPNLLSLNVHFESENHDTFEVGDVVYVPIVPTKIRTVRFSWDQRAGDEDYPAAMLFIALLHCSPEIRQVVLQYRRSLDFETRDQVLTALSGLPNLVDLQCPESVTPLVPPPTLRRLVTDSEDVDGVIYDLPETQNLVNVYIRLSLTDKAGTVDPDCEYPGPFPYDRSFYYLADGLRFHKSLRSIRPLPSSFETDDIDLFDKLDQLESRDQTYSSGLASCIHCGNGADRLILLQSPQIWREIEDRVATPQSGWDEHADYLVIAYQPDDDARGDAEPILRERVFERQAEATLCILADYRGEVVPQEVVKAMRAAAGASVEDWDRRGVQVGVGVWQILEDWYANLPDPLARRGDPGTDSEVTEGHDKSD